MIAVVSGQNITLQMDTNNKIWFDKITAALDFSSGRNNQRLIIFIICLILATILWFLNALSKNYTTQIAYPVRYIELPKNKFIINEPPSNLQLRVNAHGFTLLRYKLHMAFYPVELNVSEIIEENRLPSGSNLILRPGDILEKIRYRSAMTCRFWMCGQRPFIWFSTVLKAV
jgi:hypothetical protein